jgi:hypothetical protein
VCVILVYNCTIRVLPQGEEAWCIIVSVVYSYVIIKKLPDSVLKILPVLQYLYASGKFIYSKFIFLFLGLSVYVLLV